MGCWSEACMVSRWEIGMGEPVAMFLIAEGKYGEDLNSGAFARYNPVTPLVMGDYDDYGGVDVKDTDENKLLFAKALTSQFKDCDAFAAGTPDNIRDRDGMLPAGVHLFMMHREALDMLRTVRREFKYPKGLNTAGDVEKESAKSVRACFAELDELCKDDPMSRFIHEYGLLEKHRIGSTPRDPARGYLLRLLKRQYEDEYPLTPELAEAAAVQMGLLSLVQCGMGELRALAIPQIATGPQHNGWEAMEDYAKWITKMVKQEKKRQRDQD